MNEDWIYKLPKVELHCHLDGSLSIKTIRELAGMSGIEVPPTDGELKKCLQVTEDCGSLFEYLQKFELPIACLQTKETIEYAAYSLMKDAAEENVIYMEVRFAPRVCTAKGLTCKDAVESLWKGLEKAEQEFGILGKIIVCGMRHEQPEKNAAMLEEIKEYIGNQVCAGDLAGSESDFPPLLQTPFFEKAKELGLPFTIHAGECGSAENVQDAISLGAKRVGHGIALMKNDTIRGFTKEKGIALEMCPSSNFQTKAVSNRKEYPIRKFLEEGILVTINTDNRTVTGTTMTKEFKVLMEEFQLTKEEILKITENAINAAFIQEGTRESLRKKLESVKL